jgi:conjugal transfer pilus assembly protein TraF
MYNKLYTRIILILIIIFNIIKSGVLFAEESFYKRRAEGWHWYEERKILKNKEEDQKNKEPQRDRILTPTQFLKLYKQELERKLHLAMFFPTLENVKAYQEFQKDLMERSQLFSERWMQSIYLNPSLDFTSKYPINQIGRHAFIDEEKKVKTEKLNSLSKSYGFFFFFKGDCPYCHTFAPIIKRFAARYGWTVKAISLDGGKLKEYPKPLLDNGIAEKLAITQVPALIAVNPKTQEMLPISYGITSEDEMETRILTLIGKP